MACLNEPRRPPLRNLFITGATGMARNTGLRRDNQDTRDNAAPNSAQARSSVNGPSDTTENLQHSGILCNCCTKFYKSIDCTAACYFVIAMVMMIVGIVVTLATAKEKLINDEAGTIAQLWIVGPIFVSSGLLVFIKSCSHVYKKIRRITRDQTLTHESRPSFRGTAAFPPSYSRALVAPIPSYIVEVDDDQISNGATKDVGVGEAQVADSDSYRNVTITCHDELSPPSYREALEMQKRKTTSTALSASASTSILPKPRNEVKDASTQSELSNNNEIIENTIATTSSAAFNLNLPPTTTTTARKSRSDGNIILDTKSHSEDNIVMLVSSNNNGSKGTTSQCNEKARDQGSDPKVSCA